MEWKAKWIWTEGEEKPRNFFLMFRKAFSLPRRARSARLHITADSRYVLYINGERIGQGPPRGFPWRYHYDTYEVMPYLRPGENVVAVLVHHFGHSTFQYVQGRGGLLAQLDVDGKTVLGTDRTWKVKPCEAFARRVPRVSVQQGWEEQYDARREEMGWVEIEYDNRDWADAVELGPPGIPPWTELTPRDIPFQTDDEVQPVRVVRVEAVRSVPYTWTVDLKHTFFPGEYDSNHRTLKGFLAMEIEAEGEEQAVLRRAHHIVGRLKVNGEEVPDRDGSELHLKQGRNVLLFDISGTYHLLQFVVGLESEQGLKLHRMVALGPSLGEEFDRIWKTGDWREAPGEVLHEVPEKAVADVDVWALAAWDRKVGEEVLMEDPEALLSPNHGWTVVHPSDIGDVRILLDFGRELLAYTEFEVEAPEGAIVDFNFFEGIQEGRILLTHGLNNSLRYVCREGRQRYRSYLKRGFRYAFVIFRNLSSPVRVRYITSRLSTYPAPERGEFRCSDELLTRLWEVGRYTLRLCMDDTYLDCPAYEQTHWVGDARNEALVNWVAYGDPRITAHCLLQAADSLGRSPIPESHVPSGWEDILPTWSLLWVCAIREYWQWTGDRRFLERIYSSLKQTCDRFLGYRNNQGLLEMEGWNMIDWAPMDTPRKGVITHQNFLLVKTLKEAAIVAEVVGKKEDVSRWRTEAELLKEAINQHLWSEERRAFVDCIRSDGKFSPVISQQTHTMALLCDCVEGERAERSRELMLSPPENVVRMGSPFFGFFLFEQFAREGRLEEMLKMMREKWGFMIEQGATTFWETFPGWERDYWTRSWCHAWSSAPTYFLTTEVLGVYPEEPGFSVVRVAPCPADILRCRGRVPTPHGDVEVGWEQGEGFSLELRMPQNIEAHILLPGSGDLWVNGKRISPESPPEGVERLVVQDRTTELWLGRGGKWTFRVEMRR